MKAFIRGFLMVCGLVSLVPSLASAVWTPLITSTMFDGVATDLLTAAAGVMTICMIVLGVGILIHALSK